MKLPSLRARVLVCGVVITLLTLGWWLSLGDTDATVAPPQLTPSSKTIPAKTEVPALANSATSTNTAHTPPPPLAQSGGKPAPHALARLSGLDPELRFPSDAPAITDNWINARTLLSETRPSTSDPTLQFRVRLIEADFKYSLLRVEEALRIDPVTRAETLLAQLAMVADHVMLKPASGTTEQSLLAQLSSLGGTIRARKPASGLYLVTLSFPLELDALPAALVRFKTLSGLVAIAEPDFVVHALLTPNDPSYAQLYGLHNTGQTGGTADADIDAPEAWEITTGSRNVRVGIIDTGIDYTHPDLAANIWTNPGEIPGNGIDDDGNGYVDDFRGWDFVNNDNDPMDDHYHGTHCAGTIGAVGGNALGVVGVAHQVSLVGLKFLSATGSGTTSDAVEAVAYATGIGLDLTSNSWGGGGYSQALYDAISAANTAGQLFIAAAGNSSANTDASVNYPSGYNLPNIISVAATDQNDKLASFSNYGAASVDLAAPGVNTYSTKPGSAYQSLSGTSMATPHVSGAAALLLAHRPELSPETVKSALLASVDPLPNLTGKVVSGGRLNVHSALLALDDLQIAPFSGWSASATVGGVFPATSATYTLRNVSPTPVGWTASASAPWLTLSAASGTLQPNSLVSITVTLDTALAATLAAGTHTGQVTFLNPAASRSQTRSFSVTATPPAVFTFDLTSDPGWPRTGQWAFGQPLGQGGSSYGRPDPATGFTGQNVLGVNLAGDYSTAVGGPHTLTAGPFNLSGYAATRLQFRRWLNSDWTPYATTNVEVSTNGTTWQRVWTNGTAYITESAWSLQDIDLSAYADNQGTVYLRWTYTIGGGAWPLSGWNIDDIAILGMAPRSLTFDPLPPVNENAGSVNATLRINPAPDAPLTVSLASSAPGTVTAPAAVLVSAGATQAVVPLTILDDTLLNGTRTTLISATAATYFPVPLSVSVQDDETAALTLEIPATGTEGGTAPARLLVSIAPASPVSVSLASSLADALATPATLLIPAGATSVNFTLTFPDNTRIEPARLATLTATVPGWTSGQGSVSVADNESRALSLALSSNLAEGQGTLANAGTVSISGTLTTDLTVTLTSIDTSELTAPATVVIPAGATSVKFALTLPDDADLDGAQTVQVSATAATFTAAQATCTVADNDPASFVFDLIPSPQYVGQAFTARLVARDINAAPALGFAGTATLAGRIGTTPASLSPAQTGAFTAGVWSGPLTAATAGSGWSVLATAGSATGTSNTFNVLTPAVQILTLATNDLVYDPGTNRIYASTPSGTIVPINPATGVLDPAVTVATTATTLLARATDGSRLWVVHDNGRQALPVVLPALTAGTNFNFGVSSYGSTYQTYAADILALPGSPETLIVSRGVSGLSPSHDGVHVFDNGVRRATATARHTGSNSIAAGLNQRIYGSTTESSGYEFWRLQVGVSGISVVDSRGSLGGGRLTADGTLVTSTTGRIMDGENYRILASLPFSGPVRPDVPANRIYQLSDQGGGIQRLNAYDGTRFAEVGKMDITGVSGSPATLIRWGAGGLAFRTPTQVFLLNTPLVPNANSANLQVTQIATPNPASTGQPLNYLISIRNLGGGSADSVTLTDTLPAGAALIETALSQGSLVSANGQITATLGTLAAGAEATLRIQIVPASIGTAQNTASVSSVTGDPDTANNQSVSSVTVSPPPALALRRMAIGARDLGYDPASDRLLVTLSNTAATFPNSLLRLDPATTAAHSADFLGDNPGRLKLTSDGSFAYAILDGSYGIARAPVVSEASPGLNFPVGHTGSIYGLLQASDIAPVTGRPELLGVARNDYQSKVVLYQNGVALPNAPAYYHGANDLAEGPNEQRLYGSDGYSFYKLNVSTNGVAIDATQNGLFGSYSVNRLKRSGSLLYTNNGRVIDPEAMTLVANLNVSGPIEPSLDDEAFYILDGTTLRAYDLVTRAPLSTLALGTLDGTPSNLVRCGGRSLAFVTSTGVLYLLDAPSLVPPPPLRVRLPARLTEGVGTAPGVGRVEILRPAASDIPIQLTSSATDILDITRNIILPAGQTSVTFDVTVTDNAGLNGTRSVTVTASTPATYTPKSASVLVDDDETGTLTLTLPAALTEGAEPVSGQATVQLSGPALSPVSVALASSDTTELTVPASVTIPAGASSVTFTLTSPDDDLMDGTQPATVTATVQGYTSGAATLQVADNESRTITLTLPTSVNEGTYYAYATLTLPGKTIAPLVVSFTTSDNTELLAPGPVTVPAGSSSVTSIYCQVANDTLLDGAQSATLTASAPGFTSGSSTTSVVDDDPASALWSTIASPQTAGTAFSATFTLKTIDGLTATGFSGYVPVTATNSTGAATLSGAPFSFYISSGAGTASFTVLTAGTDTKLKAQLTGMPLIDSNPFTVQSGAVTRFAVSTLASPQLAGVPASVTLTAQDASGNTVPSFTGTAALSLVGAFHELGTGTSSSALINTIDHDRRTQVLYLASELGGARSITGLALNVLTLPSQALNNWTIRIKSTSLAAYPASPAWESTGWTVVHQGNTTVSSTGWTTFTFATPFAYNGNDNLLIDFCFNNSSWSSGGSVAATSMSGPRVIQYSTDSYYGDPLTWSGNSPSGYLDNNLPNLRLLSPAPIGSSVTPASTSAFAAGSWTGPLTFTGTSTAPVTLQASQGTLAGRSNSFTIRAPAAISVTPAATFSITGLRGEDFTNRAQIYTLTNATAENLAWTASNPVAWLALSATAGTLAPGDTTTVTATPTAAASALPSGTHSADLDFSVNGVIDATRRVELTTTPVGELALTPASGFAPNGPAGGPFTPANATWTLSNPGDAPITWIAAKTQTWLSLSATSGTLAPGATATVTASLGAPATTLTAGTYDDTITFANTTNARGNSTRAATLTVRVPQPPTITTQPAGVTIMPMENAALTVVANGDGTLAYQWYRGASGDTSSPVAGATGPLLLTPCLTTTSTYWVRVSNATGSTNSTSAAATVLSVAGLNLSAFGNNKFGQLGDGSTTNRLSPTHLTTSVIQASASEDWNSAFLKSDGTLWTMGNNSSGQLGDGTLISRSVPVQIASGVTQVSMGGSFGLFLKTDGTLWAMGRNSWGQLGDGTGTDRPTPVQVASGVVQAYAGGTHSHFIKADGTLWGMGYNGSGQLGDGSTTQRLVPVQVATNVVRVAIGAHSTHFIKTDGSLWAMGSNTDGALGDGSTTQRLLPTPIASNVTQLACGSGYTLFIKADSSLWATGNNMHGQLGNGSTTSRTSPAQVAPGVAWVSAGGGHTLFVKTDGTLWATGGNTSGQLGDGSTVNRSLPVQIDSSIHRISAGGSHSFFLSPKPGLSTQPADTAIVSGATATLTVSAVGISPFTYQWFAGTKGDTSQPMAGATAATFTTPALSTNTAYWVRVSNVHGSTDSASATITACVIPTVTVAPAPTSVALRRNVALSVAGAGGALSYQWYRGSSGDTSAPVAGATATLFVSPPITSDTSFWVRVSNPAGTADSPAAAITAQPALSLNLLSTGYNLSGQLGDDTLVSRNTPIQVASAVAQAAMGGSHSAFVKSDGTLWTMGANSYGQLGDGTTTLRTRPVQVATNATKAAAGDYFTVFLKTDGTLWGMGANSSGLLGGSVGTSASTPVQIATGVIEVAAGSGHILFVKNDATLWAAGSNSSGQLGDGTTTSRSTPVQIATGVAQISAGMYHSLFLKTDGTLWAMGSSYAGKLGQNSYLANQSTPVLAATGVARTIAGSHFSLFIKTDGTLWGMGENSSFQLANGNNYSTNTPVQIATQVAQAAAGYSHVLFVKTDGTLWATGSNYNGQFGTGNNTDASRTSPVQIHTHVVEASAAYSSSFFLSRKPGFETQPASVSILAGQAASLAAVASGPGTIACQWYQGTSGDTSAPVPGATSAAYTTPALVANASYWVRISSSFGSADSTTVTVTIATPPSFITQPPSTTVVWGRNAVLSVSASGGALSYQWYQGNTGDTSAPVPGAVGATLLTPPLLASTPYWVRVTNLAGAINSATANVTVHSADYTLKGMGGNSAGQLGNNTTTNAATPQLITTGVAQTANGDSFSLILKTDGTLWATGSNSSGQLGNGTLVNSTTPIQVASSVRQIAAGGAHGLFVKTNGTLWAMGDNSYGQLGDGTNTQRRTPIQIASNVTQADAGSSHTLFLKSDGTLWSCGYNNRGQLGNGNNSDRSTPSQIASDVAFIAAGSGQSFFIKTDATLWSFGSNSGGQLADGTITHRYVPVQVATGVAQVTTNYYFTLFVKTNRTLWAVGANWYGQLGDGTTTDRYNPVQVATNVSQADAGDRFSLFVKTDGTLWATGKNALGQLGDSTTTDRWSPVQVASGVAQVSNGTAHSHFLQSPPPVILSHPSSTAVVQGQTVSLAIAATSPIALTYQWYAGASGTTTHPISGAVYSSFTTPPVVTPLSYWVRVTNAVGSTDSQTAVLTPINPPDTDSDGLPDDWETAHGLNPASSLGDLGRLGDPDRDGTPNLLEYAMGLDPQSPDASAALNCHTAAHPTTGLPHLVFTYRRLIYPGALTYTITTSSNLTTWSAPAVTPEVISTVAHSDGRTETVTVRLNPALGTSPVFVRLQVNAP